MHALATLRAAEGLAEEGPQAPARPRAGDPAVSVVIPHRDDLDNLRRCLALLGAQTAPKETFEVIVADNNSRCGLAAVEQACLEARLGLARVIAAPIPGAAEARNAGVRASRGGVLAFLDSDCRPFPGWLQHGLEALAAGDIAGGPVDVEIRRAGEPSAVEAFEMIFAFNMRRYIEREGFAGSGNMFVPRAIFERVGGFRRGVAEDRDWGNRAVALGYRWAYAPEARVAHPARRDWADLTRKWRRLTAESYAAMKERPLGKGRWLLRNWLVLASPFVHAGIVFRTTRLSRLDHRLKALVILFRLRCWRFWESHVVLFTKP